MALRRSSISEKLSMLIRHVDDNDDDGYNSSDQSLDDDDMSMSDSGNTSDEPSRGGSTDRNNPARLVEKETQIITCSKLVVAFVLLVATGTAASITYWYTSGQEEDTFQSRFKDIASQIISVYEINAKKIFDVYDTFSLQITTYAIGSNSTWPYVTLPKFEAQATKLIEQTGARTMAIAPIVTPEDRSKWESYSSSNDWWIQEGYDYQQSTEPAPSVIPFIWNEFRRPSPAVDVQPNTEYFMPLWQASPILESSRQQNFDMLAFRSFGPTFPLVVEQRAPILSLVRNLDKEDTVPESFIVAPVFEDVGSGKIVAAVTSTLPWMNYFSNLVPEDVGTVMLVIQNTCNQTQSYLITGPDVEYLGPKDFHDSRWNSNVIQTAFNPFLNDQDCVHELLFYPTEDFRDQYISNQPIIFTVAVVLIFVATAFVFVIYDCLVEKRQDKVLTNAQQSTAIISSLFPATVRDRLMSNSTRKSKTKSTKYEQTRSMKLRDNVKPFSIEQLGGSYHKRSAAANSSEQTSAQPIADLFPEASVLFADICGFTAWSSSREPAQVFTLLETIYNSFDKIARRRHVFKVETIGDCYVAATGLPVPMEDHAVTLARFACSCLSKMSAVVKRLEVTLGPDTADLSMRIGIHSGPVTAGVLRGEKSRFQLFGDTVNTASRMESTGTQNRIHLSKESADLIATANITDLWVEPRRKMIEAKGKGELQTFWLCYGSSATLSHASAPFVSRSGHGDESKHLDQQESESTDSVIAAIPDQPLDTAQEKRDRMVDWNVDILQRLLKRVIAMRGGVSCAHKNKKLLVTQQQMGAECADCTVLDEVREIISLPNQPCSYKMDPSTVILPKKAHDQLDDFVQRIEQMYHKNSFHSFAHASHVTQSVVKLLSRVVSLDSVAVEGRRISGGSSSVRPAAMNANAASTSWHNYTYGITSDPLTQFAVVLSALIHDVDHPGVPNATLVQEQTDYARLYKNKSVAEQTSLDLAWNLLMEPCYEDLRSCIYSTQSELDRFRQLLVNSVMATDIVDKELGALRKKRWNEAFAPTFESFRNDCHSENSSKTTSTMASSNLSSHHSDTTSTHSASAAGADPSSTEHMNRMATIVIEHLIQASDVAHTMQHWHVYLKWNEKFFAESYEAFLNGRSDTDPSIGWYEGEMGFFDYYIIPLAKKLKDCEVFGVGADEYLNYAKANRAEWETKGRDIVTGYLNRAKRKITAAAAADPGVV